MTRARTFLVCPDDGIRVPIVNTLAEIEAAVESLTR